MNSIAYTNELSVVEIFPGISLEKLPDKLSGLISNRGALGICLTGNSERYKPEMLAEQDVYEKGAELKVPEAVIDFCAWHINNGLTVSIYRKHLTENCQAAIEARKPSLGEFITDSNEIKSKVIIAKLRNGERIPVAIHIEADDTITTGSPDKDTYDRKAVLQFLRHNAGLDVVKLEPDSGRMHGRQGPVSFLMESPEGIQIFDHVLLNKDILRTTNCGLNTWGCAWVNFPNVLRQVGSISSQLNDGLDRVFVAKGLTRAEREESHQPLDRVDLAGNIVRGGRFAGA